MVRAALALDVDGTIDTADPAELLRLKNAAARLHVPLYLHTARSEPYCEDPDLLTTMYVPQSRHHCLVHPYPPTSKVVNMHTIQKNAAVYHPECVILIDDRPENVDAVREQGFKAIWVDASLGIRRETVDRAIKAMERCSRRTRGPRIFALLLASLALLLLLPHTRRRVQRR